MADQSGVCGSHRHARQHVRCDRRQSRDLDDLDRLRRRKLVKLGPVVSLTRAATPPASIFSSRKWTRSGWTPLRALAPKAVRVAVLVNPANVSITETTVREVQAAGHVNGVQDTYRT